MKQLLKVVDHPNLYRDPTTKAILVMDNSARQNYINQRTLAEKTVENSQELRQEVDSLKNEIGDIKSMLTQILNRFESDK